MRIYTLKRVQKLPIDINQAWDFFSTPVNLKHITPAYMGFDIISDFENQKMYPGQIIQYHVRPKFNIPIHWVTEITHVEEPFYFVDEQRFGPYRLWHHQHHFKEDYGGIEMTDIVTYALPFGFLGGIAHGLFVKKDLNHIFDYRYEVLEKYFKSQPSSKLEVQTI